MGHRGGYRREACNDYRYNRRMPPSSTMNRALMLAAMLICPAGGSVASDEPSAECPVEGDLIHWVADYCMASIGTDDEIAASDCIDSERRRVFDGECAAKLHYKRTMCKLAVKYHSRPAPIAACVADRSFMGHTVRNRGIGN